MFAWEGLGKAAAGAERSRQAVLRAGRWVRVLVRGAGHHGWVRRPDAGSAVRTQGD